MADRSSKTKITKNLFWVIKHVFHYDKKYIFIMGFSMIVTGILPPISTLISQKIINGVQTKGKINIILIFIVAYVGIDLVSGMFNYAIAYYKTKFSQGFVLNFREKIFEKASRLSLKNYETSETYDMINRAEYEGNENLISYFETLTKICSNMVTLLSYLFILVMFNPYIAICILIVPVAKFLISKKINIMSFQILKSRTNDSRKCGYLEYLMTHGEFYKELKIYNLSAYFIGKYKEYQRRFNKEDLELTKKSICLLSCVTIIEMLVNGAIFTYVVLCGYTGRILIGNVLTYILKSEL